MILRLLTLLINCMLISVVFVAAADAKIKLSPSLTLEEKFTDNLFLDHDNEVDEWITTVEPGIGIRIDTDLIDVSLDYSFRYSHYRNNGNLTDFDFEGGQRADLGTTFFKGRPFTLRVNGTISRETLDESENSSAQNELINKSTVYDLVVNPQYRLRLGGSSSLVFGYIYDHTIHEDPRGDDSQAHSGRLSLVKELSTNSEISANYTYKVHQSDDSEEYDEQIYTLGFDQQLGPRTTIYLEGGYSTVEYAENQDTEESETWRVNISYRLMAPLTLSLALSQEFDDSSTQGLIESRDASFSIDYEKDSFWAGIEAFANESDYLRLDRNDKSYGGRFSLSLPLSRALSTGLDADYEKAEYTGAIDKDVDIYSIGASAEYTISRFLTSLQYRYRLNDSTLATDDFTENSVTFRVSVRF